MYVTTSSECWCAQSIPTDSDSAVTVAETIIVVVVVVVVIVVAAASLVLVAVVEAAAVVVCSSNSSIDSYTACDVVRGDTSSI